MIISILCSFQGIVCCHTSVGFLLFYLIWWAMRRPLLVNNQRRSALFFVSISETSNGVCRKPNNKVEAKKRILFYAP